MSAERTSWAIALGLVAVATAILMKPVPARYQIAAAGSEFVRLDAFTGEVIACDGQTCVRLLSRETAIREPTLLKN